MTCYDQCNKNYQWYEFSARRACLQGCDVNAYQENADAANEANAASSRLIFTLIISLAIVTVFFIIGKKKNWI